MNAKITWLADITSEPWDADTADASAWAAPGRGSTVREVAAAIGLLVDDDRPTSLLVPKMEPTCPVKKAAMIRRAEWALREAGIRVGRRRGRR